MKLKKLFIGILIGWATAIVFAPVVGPLLIKPAIAHGFIDAASLDVLRNTISPVGITVWPSFSADPVTCNAQSEGGYYFNTGTSLFRTCDGTSWADREGASSIGALSDVVITSVADGQVLQYDGVTDNRWENVATSATAVNDLTDVVVTSVSDGHILQYDGVTDMRWENVAGSSASLSGLTDTNITAAADREVLRYDGTDWVDEKEHVGAPYYLFPVYDATGFSNTSNAIIGADNQVKAFCWNFPHPINIDRIIWETDTVSGTGCDFGAVGIYSLDGNTKIADSGAVAYSANDTVLTADITNVYLEPGTYYVAYTATETVSCTVLADDAPAGTNDGYEDLYQELAAGSSCKMAGTAANASTAGALPTTLGTVTWNGNILRPIIMFEGADPP